jgi:hypothetical protein
LNRAPESVYYGMKWSGLLRLLVDNPHVATCFSIN